MSAISTLAKPLAQAFYPSEFFNKSILNSLQHLPTSYSLSGLKSWYLTADPMHPALLFMAVVSFLVWSVGELTGESIECWISRMSADEDSLKVMYHKWIDCGHFYQSFILLISLFSLKSLEPVNWMRECWSYSDYKCSGLSDWRETHIFEVSSIRAYCSLFYSRSLIVSL